MAKINDVDLAAAAELLNKLKEIQKVSNDDVEIEDSWTNKLQVHKNGSYQTLISNYSLWLENGSHRYTGRLKYNEFFDCVELNGKMVQEDEEYYCMKEAEQFFSHNVSRQNLKAAFSIYAKENGYNPIKDYLDGLKGKWDGVSRVERYIIDTLDADDSELNRFFSKTWILGAVKRVYEPGCQFDCVLALQGGIQGAGKTTLFRRLFKEKYYKTFSSGEFTNKDAIDKMNKSWAVLLDEFDKFSDKEVADLKCKITEKSMSCRKAYGHDTSEYKVHWVYAATTNADDFLCDLTGDEYERRYWIVECKKSTVDSKVSDVLTDEYVDQLWAEAVHIYSQDPRQELFLNSKNKLYEEYKNYQLRFKKTSKNPTQDYLNEILEKPYKIDAKGWFKDSIDMYEQFVGNIPVDNGDKLNAVPCSYVKHILNKVYGINCQPKLIKSLLQQMGGEWEIKNSKWYLNKSISNVLVRVNEIDSKASDKNDDIDPILPF